MTEEDWKKVAEDMKGKKIDPSTGRYERKRSAPKPPAPKPPKPPAPKPPKPKTVKPKKKKA